MGGVYIVSRLSTLHWTTNKEGSFQRETNSLSLSILLQWQEKQQMSSSFLSLFPAPYFVPPLYAVRIWFSSNLGKGSSLITGFASSLSWDIPALKTPRDKQLLGKPNQKGNQITKDKSTSFPSEYIFISEMISHRTELKQATLLTSLRALFFYHSNWLIARNILFYFFKNIDHCQCILQACAGRNYSFLIIRVYLLSALCLAAAVSGVYSKYPEGMNEWTM